MSCTTSPDWSGYTVDNFPNKTLLENLDTLCNQCICPLEWNGKKLAVIEYFPNLGGNALFAAIFGGILLTQIIFGIRTRTWGFLAAMFGGIILELIGYVARILMRYNMFNQNYFIMYLVCLTIAPAFLSAAIYLTLSRLITIYAPSKARFKPQRYTHIFICCDLLALVLQAAGGAIASIADAGSSLQQTGINLMIAGVAWQVVSLALFAALSLDFFLRVRKAYEGEMNPVFVEVRAKRSFTWFIWAVLVAGVAIFVRSVFRCAELSAGFNGPLANDEVTFMILEGCMIIIAVGGLTFLHPGVVVGAEGWKRASWKKGKGGYTTDQEVLEGSSVEMMGGYKGLKSGERGNMTSDGEY